MILELLSKKTGLSETKLKLFINSASHRYKVYTIPKRKGGQRVISHPSKELKVLQRIAMENFLTSFPVHESVCSYRKGVGIRDNAIKHAKNNYMLRIDFQNFFPSIKWMDIAKCLKEGNKDFSPADVVWLSKLFCKKLGLTIGAPSSPMLSNIVLYEFDCEIYKMASERKITFTRYADDMFFSTNEPNVLEGFLADFKKLIQDEKFPKLKINNTKTIFTSRKRKKVVTGLVLTSDKKVSIGRDKKRYIKSLVHKFRLKQLDTEKQQFLKGQISYISSVEPTFIETIVKKYGRETLNKIVSL